MSNHIKILDKSTNELLNEYCIEELEIASARARELEEWGLDVKVIVPNVIETLGHSLGQLDKKKLDEEINEEISDH